MQKSFWTVFILVDSWKLDPPQKDVNENSENSTKNESEQSSNAAEYDRVPLNFDFHEDDAKCSAHHSWKANFHEWESF